MQRSLLIAAVALAACAAAAAPQTKFLGQFSAPTAGFLTLHTTPEDPAHAYTLVISEFPTMGAGSVRMVPHVGDKLNDVKNIKPEPLLPSTTWPNFVTHGPKNVFGFETLLVAGGFIPPTVSTGLITAVRYSAKDGGDLATKHMVKSKSGWFYHYCKVVDVNGDGLPDILAARATMPIFGSKKGEMLWLEHPEPEYNPWTTEWKEHVLFEGPDVFFDTADIDGDGKWEIVAGQFFTEKLVLYYTEGTYAAGPWKARVLDASIGALMGTLVHDFNGDGKLDILVTNHVDNATLSGVYAYDVPADIRNGTFVRHTLASGFVTTLKGQHQASPGIITPCHAKLPAPENDRPLLLLAGDGSQQVYLLSPKNPEGHDWDYDLQIVLTWKGTAGRVAAGDVDGDGLTEFFAPNWDQGQIHVYRILP